MIGRSSTIDHHMAAGCAAAAATCPAASSACLTGDTRNCTSWDTDPSTRHTAPAATRHLDDTIRFLPVTVPPRRAAPLTIARGPVPEPEAPVPRTRDAREGKEERLNQWRALFGPPSRTARHWPSGPESGGAVSPTPPQRVGAA